MPINPQKYDDFMRLCSQIEDETEELRAKLRKFRSRSEAGLREVIFTYYPELIPHKEALIEQIDVEIDFHLDMVNENCNSVFSGLEVDESDIVVFRQEMTDFEAEMATARAEMHRYGTEAEAFLEDWRRWTNHEIAEENFIYRCQQTVKQAAYEAFPEILHFSANALRHIEYSINLHLNEFNAGFQFITSGYRWERFGDGGTVLAEDMREEEE